MSFEIFSTKLFEKELKSLLKKYPSVKEDILTLISTLSTEPLSGVSIGKDCYKIRMSIKSKGKGKSGGSRVITCVKVVQKSVFLLSIYDKSEKESIDDKDLIAILVAANLM